MQKTSSQNCEMNLLWKKDKLQKYSKESIATELAAGDGEQCRLCGARDLLQHITSGRLDQTLRLYFGVDVPPEGLICESCIKCMKITEGFSALVHASFDKTVSEDSSGHTRILAEFSPGNTNLPATSPQKEILSLLKTKLSLVQPKTRERKKLANINCNGVYKKMIIACTACGQKYPMFMSEVDAKKFVCSRCQKGGKYSKNNVSSGNKELRCKIELRGKKRLNSLPPKPQIKLNNSATKFDSTARYRSNHCTKQYAIADNLATHKRTVLEGCPTHVCAVCGKKFKSKENLDKHNMKDHVGAKVFKCSKCMRCFYSSRALQTHSVYHDKHRKSFSS